MVIFYNAHAAINHMCKYIDAKKPKTVCISTFGLWVGNTNVDIPSCNLLKLLSKHKINTDIIVGHNNQKPIDYLKTIRYDTNYITFYVSDHNHAKYILCDDTYAMIGSANLNDSKWGDITSCDYLRKPDYDDIFKFHTEMIKQSTELSKIPNHTPKPESKKESGVLLKLW